tara:strand:- start:457 stop:885 length:429 start_codon:yes stop_codon:yes gene_type:complete
MPSLKTDKWPHFYFYDVSDKNKYNLKVHKDDVKLKKRVTKTGGPGNYHAIIAVGQGSQGQDVWKWTSAENYLRLKEKFKKEKKTSPTKSKKTQRSPQKCNVLNSGKKKTKEQCLKSPKTCRWVSGKKKSRKSPARKGYCRRV